MQDRQNYFELFLELQEVVTVELDIILNVLALEEHVFEDPVADCLIEALKKGSADRHDPLEVPDFEGYSGYDSIQFESILIHSLLVLAFKVPTGPVEVLAVFVFLRKVRLSKMGLTKHVRRKQSHGQVPVILVLEETDSRSPPQCTCASLKND